MLRSLVAVLVFISVTILSFVAIAAAPRGFENLDGKEVFLKYKCNICHSVSTAGIEAKTKTQAPDLVNVTVRHEKLWIRKYIRQNEVHVSCPKVDKSRDGQKHMSKFGGTQEEEDALIEWLDRQRSGK